MTELLTDSYAVSDFLHDHEGFEKATIAFAPGIDHDSLCWKLANELFGKGHWRVTERSVNRTCHFPNGPYPDLGPWHWTYKLVRR